MNIIYEKYKKVLTYLFFGVCTTGVNVIVYWLLAHVLRVETMPSTIVAWITAVLFAYVTNRKWVFESNIHTFEEFVHELMSFFACRLVTGVFDWIIMYVFVETLLLNDTIIKLLANIVVIMLNFVMSKVIVFRNQKENVG